MSALGSLGTLCAQAGSRKTAIAEGTREAGPLPVDGSLQRCYSGYISSRTRLHAKATGVALALEGQSPSRIQHFTKV